MPVNFVNIPDALKQSASFCVWKMEKRSGRPTKVPYNPRTGNMAKTNDPSTFADFKTAMKTYAIGGWDGIGYRVSEGIGAIDIDDEENSGLGIESLEVFEQPSWVMAKHADPENVPDDPDEWLEQFNVFSIYQILPELIELWGLNMKSQAESKKSLSQLTAK